MGEQREDQREDPRRVMVNSDEELVVALKNINETLKVKEAPKLERKIININNNIFIMRIFCIHFK
jgi:hypothetical protein